MLPSPQIEQARSTATRAHHGRSDKIGAPYIQHPAMVASLIQALPDFEATDLETQQHVVVAAWLHDVSEDTDETAESLRAAEIAPKAVDTVVALTPTDHVVPDDNYAGVAISPIARLVRTTDVASNLAPERVAQLDAATRSRLAVKYDHALAVLRVDRSVSTALHASKADR
jgi:hypothetical protein